MGVSKVSPPYLYISLGIKFVICVIKGTVMFLTVNCVCFQLHAEVHFDQGQQSYMLVDQGSQNGTVINGNRILQVRIFSVCCL